MSTAFAEYGTETLEKVDLQTYSAPQCPRVPFGEGTKAISQETGKITDQELGYWIRLNTKLCSLPRAMCDGAPQANQSWAVTLSTWWKAFAPIRAESPPTNTKWRKLYSELEGLKSLQDGWDSFKAPAPNVASRTNAKQFLDVLCIAEYFPNRIRPSVVGGIGITFRADERKVYVEFQNDGRVYVLFSDGITDPQTQRISNGYVGFLSLIPEIRDYVNG